MTAMRHEATAIRRWLTLTTIVLCHTLLPACSNESLGATKSLSDSQKIHPDQWPRSALAPTREPEIERRISTLLSQMKLEEKVGQIIQADIGSVTPEQVRRYHLGSVLNGGNSAPAQNTHRNASAWLELADRFWLASTDKSNGGVGIPVMWGTDAVHGHSNVLGATILPHNIGLGAMHDPALMRNLGELTAEEMLVTGIDWTFAPTIAVARDDRWGRTYESFSENPPLVRDYVTPFIEGLQGKMGTPEYLDSHHILATVKHFLGDGGTLEGKDQGNTMVSEEELREVHGVGYPAAINAGAMIVMASFSSWQGQAMHGNASLLRDVLVGRMGLDGFVVGDWNGHHKVSGCTATSCSAAFNAGLDMFMAPDSWEELYKNTLQQVQAGEITATRLDEAVARILRVKFRIGLMDAPMPSRRVLAGKYELLASPEHRALAREAARKSLVLLKNTGRLLPLTPRSKVLVAGDGADDIGKQSGGWTLGWQGSGKRNGEFPNGESIVAGIRKAVESAGGSVAFNEQGEYRSKPDVAVVVFGEDPYAEFQGDRVNLDFDDDRGLKILARMKQAGIPTVAVFLSGRPLWVNPELNKSDAFVAAFLPGSEGGAIADVLFSDRSGKPAFPFSGQLSFSWPNNATGSALNIGDNNYEPLFRFGYGLTYADDKATAAAMSMSPRQ